LLKPFLFTLSSLLSLSAPAFSQTTTPESVLVTRDAAEVKGLAKVGEVEGRSPFFGLTAKKGTKDATRKLQEEAAKLGATKVLIVHEDAMGATTLQGLAYRGGSKALPTITPAPTKVEAPTASGTWETVVITRDPAEMKGLKKAGEIEGRSPFFGLTAKKGDKDARKKLQQAAAALGATKVLIVHEDTMGATTLQGIAYK
jgi:uncharacterized protein YbjQ (UPF0145 family)